ncbi:hypothetical protein [Xylanibacter muris]|nr:hypothetical protein [Xylanibacter muris]
MDERFRQYTCLMLPHALPFSPLWGAGVAPSTSMDIALRCVRRV